MEQPGLGRLPLSSSLVYSTLLPICLGHLGVEVGQVQQLHLHTSLGHTPLQLLRQDLRVPVPTVTYLLSGSERGCTCHRTTGRVPWVASPSSSDRTAVALVIGQQVVSLMRTS